MVSIVGPDYYVSKYVRLCTSTRFPGACYECICSFIKDKQLSYVWYNMYTWYSVSADWFRYKQFFFLLEIPRKKMLALGARAPHFKRTTEVPLWARFALPPTTFSYADQAPIQCLVYPCMVLLSDIKFQSCITAVASCKHPCDHLCWCHTGQRSPPDVSLGRSSWAGVAPNKRPEGRVVCMRQLYDFKIGKQDHVMINRCWLRGFDQPRRMLSVGRWIEPIGTYFVRFVF